MFSSEEENCLLIWFCIPQLWGFLESGWNFPVPVVALCVGDIERGQYNLTGKRA